MSREYRRSIEMVEQELQRIAKSSYPDTDLCEGMIQANLAHGFISQAESVELTQRVVDAVSARRQVLHRQSAASRMAVFQQQYGRTP